MPNAQIPLQASLQQGKPGDAESEMLAIAGADSAPVDLVLESVASMAALPGVSGSILSAAALLMRRHLQDVKLPVLLVEALFGSCDGQALLPPPPSRVSRARYLFALTV
jgi:hypothetical protein